MMDSAKERDVLDRSESAPVSEDAPQPDEAGEKQAPDNSRKANPGTGCFDFDCRCLSRHACGHASPGGCDSVAAYDILGSLSHHPPWDLRGIILLKGCRDYRAVILTAVFSLPGIYLTLLFQNAAVFAALYNIPLSNIPMIAITNIGRLDFSEVSSDFIYALIFAALGIWISWELFRKKPAD
jgi:hypothetical protein